MKVFLRLVLCLIGLLVVLFASAYLDGTTLPVDHVASVSGTIHASPDRTFALITGVSIFPSWRHEVQSVDVLPPEAGHDHWIEHLGHRTNMEFHATSTVPVDSTGHGRREVLLKDAAYGGSWIYELAPGAAANETQLKITETGYIHPPIFRFLMVHLFGMTRNLDQFMREIRVEAAKG